MIRLTEDELKSGLVQWSNHPRDKAGIRYRVWLKWVPNDQYAVFAKEPDRSSFGVLRLVERKFVELDSAQRCFDRLEREAAIRCAIDALELK